MSGKIQKSQIRPVHRKDLPPEVYEEWIRCKESARSLSGKRFTNERGGFVGDGSPLPKPAKGFGYFEFQVGAAHSDDPRPTGKRRLVLEVHLQNGDVGESYYTDLHYCKGSFIRIL